MKDLNLNEKVKIYDQWQDLARGLRVD